jgi:lipid-binding SYLF domain-containing protein
MKGKTKTLVTALALIIFLAGVTASASVLVPSKAEINRDVTAALEQLYANNPTAKVIGEKAVAVLVFPSITKGGFIVGGQYGVGALRKAGKTVGYFNTVAGSWGLQAGIQKYGYALFFMNKNAMTTLKNRKGWELGTGPSIVIVDEGLAKSLTTTTLKDDVYAVIFDQKGLMAGIGLQGSKISRIHPDK